MARIFIGNIKGPQGERGPQGEQGPVGPQGPQGPLPPLVNNALATEAGVSALDAAMGKTLQDQITDNKDDITELNSKLEGKIICGTITCSYSSRYDLIGTKSCDAGYKAIFVTPKVPIGKSDIQYSANFSGNMFTVRAFSQSAVFEQGNTVDVYYAIMY